MRALLRLVASAVVSVAAGCALMMDPSNIPFAPAPAPKGETALAYIYRTGGTHGGGWAPMVSVDGKPVFYFRLTEYSAIYLKPGRHTVEFDGKPAGLDFEVKAGTTYTLAYVLGYSNNPMIGVSTPAGLIMVPMPSQPATPGGWIFSEDIVPTGYPYQLQKAFYRRSQTMEYLSPADIARYSAGAK